MGASFLGDKEASAGIYGSFAVGFHQSIYSDVLEEIGRHEGTVGRSVLPTMARKFSDKAVVLSPNLIIPDLEDSDYEPTPR